MCIIPLSLPGPNLCSSPSGKMDQLMISMAIQACKRNGRKIGICGQGPSDYPDFAEFLVSEGIDSLSIVPDSLIKTTHAVHQLEQKLASEAVDEV